MHNSEKNKRRKSVSLEYAFFNLSFTILENFQKQSAGIKRWLIELLKLFYSLK